MITSRTHAAIDAGVAVALAGVACMPIASARVRWWAAAGALFQAGYSAATDYEGGLAPRLSLQEHRAFDVTGAAALGVAGAVLRSPVLVAAGAANLAVALLGEAHSHGGAPRTLYAPLDVPKRLARDVWVVDSAVGPGIPVRMTVIRLRDGELLLHSPTRHSAGLQRALEAIGTVRHLVAPDVPKRLARDVWVVDSAVGPGIPVRMTVIRLRDGELLLHSPTRHSAGLQRALEAIGTVRHLVAPNSVHWMFVKGWQDAVPGSVTYGAPGLRRRGPVRRAGLRVDEELSASAPAAWAGEIEQEVVPGGAGFREVALYHRASGTLLMTDLVQNFEPGKLPWVVRPMAWALGNTTRRSRAPMHLRAVVDLGPRRKAAEAARRIVGWRPERVVVTHGRVIEEDAAERLRASFGWLTG